MFGMLSGYDRKVLAETPSPARTIAMSGVTTAIGTFGVLPLIAVAFFMLRAERARSPVLMANSG